MRVRRSVWRPFQPECLGFDRPAATPVPREAPHLLYSSRLKSWKRKSLFLSMKPSTEYLGEGRGRASEETRGF